MKGKAYTQKRISDADAAGASPDAIAWSGAVRALISEGKIVEFSPKGYSMWPALRPDKDTVRLEATCDYGKSDIVLAVCARPYGVFMHRIVGVRPDGFLLMGDSNLYQTEFCRREDIIGKVTGIIRNGRDMAGSPADRILTKLQNTHPQFRRVFVRIAKLYLKYRGYDR